METEKSRCAWCPVNNPVYQAYHDEEWGVPVHDDRSLFEMLCLEGMQAGLSWWSILKRRETYRKAFDHFDWNRIIDYSEEKVAELLQDPGIIRNKLKVRGIIKNARVFKEIRKEFGSFDAYLWDYVGGKPFVNSFTSLKEMPTQSDISEKISKDLKRRGMTFVGPVIIYAYMQAVGLVNDHEMSCFRYDEVGKESSC